MGAHAPLHPRSLYERTNQEHAFTTRNHDKRQARRHLNHLGVTRFVMVGVWSWPFPTPPGPARQLGNAAGPLEKVPTVARGPMHPLDARLRALQRHALGQPNR